MGNKVVAAEQPRSSRHSIIIWINPIPWSRRAFMELLLVVITRFPTF